MPWNCNHTTLGVWVFHFHFPHAHTTPFPFLDCHHPFSPCSFSTGLRKSFGTKEVHTICHGRLVFCVFVTQEVRPASMEHRKASPSATSVCYSLSLITSLSVFLSFESLRWKETTHRYPIFDIEPANRTPCTDDRIFYGTQPRRNLDPFDLACHHLV